MYSTHINFLWLLAILLDLVIKAPPHYPLFLHSPPADWNTILGSLLCTIVVLYVYPLLWELLLLFEILGYFLNNKG